MDNTSRSTELNEIWSLFAEEGSENLSLVETSLLTLAKNADDAQQIAALFRAMHSFKGGARMMGLSVVESLAHHAEDLIALVRDDGVMLQGEMIDLLLAVMDRLRAMLIQVLEGGHDVEPSQAEELVEALKQMIARSREKSSQPQTLIVQTKVSDELAVPDDVVAAVAEPVSKEARHEVQPALAVSPTGSLAPRGRPQERAQGAMLQGLSDNLPETNADSESAPSTALTPLGSAEINDLAGFLHASEGWLGELHSALDALSGQSLAALSQIRSVAENMKSAAEGMSYLRLAAVLQDIIEGAREDTSTDAPSTDANKRVIVLKRLEMTLFEELTRIQEANNDRKETEGTGEENNWTDIAWLFRNWNAERVFSDLAHLSQIANDLDQVKRQYVADINASSQGERLATEATVLLRGIYHSCIFYHLDQAVHLTLALEDLYARIMQGELILNQALTDLTRAYVKELGSSIDAIREGETHTPEGLSGLIEQAENILYQQTEGPVMQITRSVIDVLDLPEEFKEVTTPETLAQFSQALKAGEHFYTLLADLEQDEMLAASLLEWSHSEEIRLITNVTVYRYGRTLFNFLISTLQNRETLLQSLVKMDPQWKNLTLQECTLLEGIDAHSRPEQDAQIQDQSVEASTAIANGVATEVLNNLLETVGEIVADHATLQRLIQRVTDGDTIEMLLHLAKDAGNNGTGSQPARQILSEDWSESLHMLRQVESQMGAALGRLQEATRSLRLLPVSEMLEPLRRVVQELTHQQGKLVELDLQGTDLKIDRAAVQLLAEPVRQLVWFAATQGIEDAVQRRTAGKSPMGHVSVKVITREDHVQVVIEDDGRGIDRELIRQRARQLDWIGSDDVTKDTLELILRGGYGKVRSCDDTEGLDLAAMYSELQARHGKLSVTSELGKGTCFKLHLPLDMAVVDGMVVRVGGVRYVVPVNAIRRIVKPEATDLMHSSAEGSHNMLQFEGGMVQIQALGGNGKSEAAHDLMVVVEGEQGRMAFPIDELIGRQQVLVRPLQGQLADVQDASGCALLGEGEVGMVLNLKAVGLAA